jgi:pyruvate dehydrogenase E2 component (dihydrolipoamide acetyltransferase)
MPQAILCPQVGQDLTEAKVVEITVKLGDRVKKGDLVAVVESEKASFDVEAFSEGVVIALPFKEGDTATVLEPLIVLGEPGEVPAPAPAVAAPATAAPAAAAAAPAPVAVAAAAPVPAASPATGPARSSPAARRAAETAGLDLARIAGSGPAGAVVLRDVASARPAAAGPALDLRTLKAGQGDPILMVHGFGADLSAWRVFAMELATDRPVLALDLPGHGASHAHAAATFDAMAAALAASLPPAAHLVGHSLGAALSVRAAALVPGRVRSLTLIAPAGLTPGVNGDFVAGFLAARSEPALSQWMRLLVGDPDRLPPVLVRATLAARAAPGVTDGQARIAQGVFEGSTQLFAIGADLAAFPGPVSVIQGTADRILDGAGVLASLPPHAAAHRLPRAGHLPQVEAAGLVATVLLRTVRAAG